MKAKEAIKANLPPIKRRQLTRSCIATSSSGSGQYRNCRQTASCHAPGAVCAAFLPIALWIAPGGTEKSMTYSSVILSSQGVR